MQLHGIFYNSDGVLRSGWRIAVFIVALAVFGFGIGIPVYAVLAAFQKEIHPGSQVYLILMSAISLAAPISAAWICGRFLEGLPFKAFGASFSRGWFNHFTAGILLGAASITLAVVIALVFGDFSLKLNPAGSNAIFTSMAISFALFAVAAAFEESLFRGYILQTLSRAGLAWLAILLTAVFFMAVHLGNPETNLIAAINTGLAGVWFGIAYLRTRDLWFVWGIHLMWNWMQGAVYGIEVSGLTNLAAQPFFNELDNGPTWLTGGKYGIEGGVAATISLLVTIAAVTYSPEFEPDPEMVALTNPKPKD